MTILDGNEDHQKVYDAISDVLHLLLENPHGPFPSEDAPVIRTVYVSAWGCRCKISVVAEWDERPKEGTEP
jgi:hypothetical protein